MSVNATDMTYPKSAPDFDVWWPTDFTGLRLETLWLKIKT